MKKFEIASAKLNVVFRQGELPVVDPNDPNFVLSLCGERGITVKINPKAARKLATHQYGAVLQGRLVSQNNQLTLLDAGFQFIEPKNVEPKVEASPPAESRGPLGARMETTGESRQKSSTASGSRAEQTA